jgi:tRNA (guanosine-2'-O-)-methyltransferase
MATEKRLDKIENIVKNRRKDIVVVLEDIYDPHNAQAVFRSCDAFGIQNIYIIFENQKPFDPRSIGKSISTSSNKWLDFFIYYSTKKCLNYLKQKGYTIIATSLDKGTDVLFGHKFQEKKIALIFGNEHAGLSRRALDVADKKLMIPMQGMVQSFNLSVSAGIFLFEVTRQKQKSLGLFSEKEQKSIITNLLKR